MSEAKLDGVPPSCPMFEVDPWWVGHVVDREVVSTSGGAQGHIYHSYATGAGAEPLTGWGKDVVHLDWTPSSTTDAVLKAGTEVTSGSPPSCDTYSMGSWGGNLTKSLETDQAIFEVYEAKWSGGVWIKTGGLLGVMIVRSDSLEYHKAASTSGPPSSISGDRTKPLYLEAKSSIDLAPGSGKCWYSAVDAQV